MVRYGLVIPKKPKFFFLVLISSPYPANLVCLFIELVTKLQLYYLILLEYKISVGLPLNSSTSQIQTFVTVFIKLLLHVNFYNLHFKFINL